MIFGLLAYINVFGFYYSRDDKKPIQNVWHLLRVFTAVVVLIVWFVPYTWLYLLFFPLLVLLGVLAYYMSYIHYYDSLVRETYLTSAVTAWGFALIVLALFIRGLLV